jgi:hypothetical protein
MARAITAQKLHNGCIPKRESAEVIQHISCILRRELTEGFAATSILLPLFYVANHGELANGRRGTLTGELLSQFGYGIQNRKAKQKLSRKESFLLDMVNQWFDQPTIEAV